MIKLPSIWLGDEQSFAEAVTRSLRLEQIPVSARPRAFAQDEDEEAPFEEQMASSLIEVYDSVGVVSINGPLVNSEDPFNLWLGYTGYPTIGRALNQLLEDDDVKSIVLAFSSPGGDADGVGDVSDAIRATDLVKPVYAWTGSSMLSAAYWLGATARKTYGTKVARAGSIGAVTTFTSISRRLKEQGIDVEVVRSSPMKAMPHPAEPLSEKGRDKLQKEVDFFHTLFMDHIVSERPNLSSHRAKESWASGESFFGQEALEMGLLDAPLISLNSLISELDSVHNSRESFGGTAMPQRVVINAEASEAARAAISAGVPASALAPELTANTQISEESDPPEAPSEEPGEAVPPVPDPIEASAEPKAPVEETSGFTSLVKELHSETTRLSLRVAELERDKGGLESHVAELQTMRPALEKAVHRLEVGLGHRPAELDKLPTNQLVETYDSLYSELMALPMGRKSVSEPGGEPAEPPPGEMNSVVEQRLRIVPRARA